jgi:5-formyltetrahydrofolate cyclo-ligase
MDKTLLRQSAQDRLREFPWELRQSASLEIIRRLAELPFWNRCRTIAFYYPFSYEPDLRSLLWHWASLPGRLAALPRASGGLYGPPELALVQKELDLRKGPRNLWEPLPEAQALPLSRVEVVLVPGLAFDSCGVRLGRGAGWYDRLLAVLPRGTVRVGVFFSLQQWPRLPRDPWDQPLEIIVTEKQTLRVSGSSIVGA